MHPVRPTPLLLAAIAAATFAPGAMAKTPPAATDAAAETARIAQILAQRAQVQHITRVALASDGQRLAYIIDQHGKHQLELVDTGGTVVRTPKLAGDCQPEDIAWQRDAAALAVLTQCQVDPSNTKPIQSTIQLINAAGHADARVLAQLDGFAQSLSWSPDGKRIGFLFVPGATRLPFATASGNPRVGVIGVHDIQVQRVASIGVAGGKPALLTPANLYAYEFAWSPHGGRIAYTAAKPPGDNNWWSARLYVQKAAPDAAPKVIVNPATVTGSLHGLQLALPRWSPDAGHVLFIGGLMSDRGATGGDIYSVPATGGAPTNLTPGVAVTPSWFTFLDRHTLLVSQIARGHIEVTSYALSDAGRRATATHPWFTAPGALGDGGAALALSISDTEPRRIAYVGSAFDAPPEVHTGALATQPPPAVTAINHGLAHTWGKAESVTWNSHGTPVQGWLMYPVHFDPRQTYPLIVYVHGGPSWANLPSWENSASALSEFGYFVLMPNPRGSFGEGEKFAQAIRNQMGYGDLDDILAGVDQVEKMAPIDDHRLGMLGWSYGGFMSMFAPTQTNRFKAVVAGAGIANWQSYYGQNQIDGWMIPFFGASVYAAPAAYAKSSAINFITHDRTPALIVVGERDEECPAPQSFEYWHALKTLGVPTTLVVYANQGHHIANQADQVDILRRTLDWFGKYLVATPGH